MEAVKFLKEKQRMCKSVTYSCVGCPLYKLKEHETIGCTTILQDYPEEAVELVEWWAQVHPVKTYAQDFFEKFPNTAKDCNGLPLLCKRHVYGGECTYNCSACWNEPMEETE